MLVALLKKGAFWWPQSTSNDNLIGHNQLIILKAGSIILSFNFFEVKVKIGKLQPWLN